MKKEEPRESIVQNGGWNKIEVTEIQTIHGFRYYLFWFIFVLTALIIIASIHIMENKKLFVWGTFSPLLIAVLLGQIFLSWKLLRSYGRKTKTEEVSYKTEINNPDCDKRNLY